MGPYLPLEGKVAVRVLLQHLGCQFLRLLVLTLCLEVHRLQVNKPLIFLVFFPLLPIIFGLT